MKDTKLTFTLHIGDKQIDKPTDEQLERMSERLSETMRLYYLAHPEEYAKIKNTDLTKSSTKKEISPTE